ncbi:Glucose 1-dehydrogenase [compost metagenome]|jgi:NAD(P)-dependent dehydrogenase (short-subunit alcohol dehydrogenase family)
MTTFNPAEKTYSGKVAIVTGAASGIGLATVELLHEQGASVVAVDRNEDVHALARPGVEPLVADVAREESAVLAAQTAMERHGRLDILVNNAGVIINKPVIEMTLADWNGIQAVNSTGAFLFSREAMRVMVPARQGSIVNVGSYACYQAFPTIAAYAASKGALAQLTRALSLEAIEHGIRVNAVGSGDVVTNITNHIHADGRAFLAEHGKNAPIRRAAQPREIAEVIAFLASEKASYIVGAVVMADGGMSVALR